MSATDDEAGPKDAPPTVEADAKVCVFGPALVLTVTVESVGDAESQFADIHFHPGGQGFWIARMVNYLGCPAVLVAPTGGEAGRVLTGLVELWDVPLATIEVADGSPAYVHDRRAGEREELALSCPPAFDRHELDDLYGLLLEKSLSAGVCVLSGKPEGDLLPIDFYQRLGADLSAMGVPVVGDLHGPELEALLDRGAIQMLKVSDDDLVADGLLPAGADVGARMAAAERLVERGAANVVISSDIETPTVAVLDGRRFTVTVPELDAVDPRGSGDSMTAGLVVALVDGYPPDQTLRYACAAGAANATRHGLGNAKAGVVEAIAERIEVTALN